MSNELLERIAEIIRDEVRLTADGIIYNSNDVARMIVKLVENSK